MKIITTFLFVVFIIAGTVYGQAGWKLCNGPAFTRRVDDIFMLDTKTGYAVCGDGKIVKTTDGGDNWITVQETPGVACRSVEFIDTQKGFVGGFPLFNSTGINILRRTIDGGATWTDLTPLLPTKAKKGICGLAVADANTIYGGGVWYGDSGYIIKSVDGGDSWNLIDMGAYASNIIDMHFINKDVGFVTGSSPLPLKTAVILYTTDGGATWSYKFKKDQASEYCWKIQRLNSKTYFAAVEDLLDVPPRILKSTDGGMNWSVHQVATEKYYIEGIGFLNEKKGWTGGGANFSFESNNGGITWDTIPTCPYMNRVFRVNDTMLLASGDRIYKYSSGGFIPAIPANRYAWLKCYPNPVNDMLNIGISVSVSTRALLVLLDNSGKRVHIITNADVQRGSYNYTFNTRHLPAGIYYVVLKTHEDNVLTKIIVSR